MDEPDPQAEAESRGGFGWQLGGPIAGDEPYERRAEEIHREVVDKARKVDELAERDPEDEGPDDYPTLGGLIAALMGRVAELNARIERLENGTARSQPPSGSSNQGSQQKS